MALNIEFTLNFDDITKTGLSLTFTTFKKISDNSVVSAPTISELGDGFYKFTFDVESSDSDIYFVASDGGSNFITGRVVRDNNIALKDNIDRALGLMQENQFIDNTVYDANSNLTSARIRAYTVAGSVGTGSDVLATYNVTAVYSGQELTSYEVVKA